MSDIPESESPETKSSETESPETESPETKSPETESLGDLSDLADGELRVFEDIGDYGIVVCRVYGELYAVVDNCSHADTPLSEGRLRGAVLVCPLHGAGFDVRDGTHTGPPAYEGVACHRVHAPSDEGGEVRVEISPIPDDGGGNSIGGRLQTR